MPHQRSKTPVKPAGPKPKRGRSRLTAEQIVERNRLLIKDRAVGLAWKTIAQKYSLSVPGAKLVWTNYRNEQKPHLRGKDPLDVVFEVNERYERLIEELAEVVSSADTPATKISAISAQVSVTSKQMDLLQQTGILPRHLGQLRVIADVRHIALKIIEVMEAHKVPENVQEALVAALGNSLN